MKKTCLSKSLNLTLSGLLGILLFVPPSAQADAIPVEFAKVAAELGVSTIKESSSSADFTIPASVLAPELRSMKLEEALSKYADLRAAYTSAKSGTNTLASVTDAFIGGSAATGNILGILVGGVLRGTVELGHQSLDEYSERRSREYLVGVADQLISESGVADFESLVSDPKLLKDTLENSSTLLNDVRERALQTNDPALLAAVAASIAQVADQKAVTTYNLAADTAVDVAELDTEFSAFSNFVAQKFDEANERLDDHERRLVGLESNVNELEGAVTEMQTAIGQLGRNQDLIADFVFTRMTPEERVRALKSGLVDNRIQCPDDAASCDKTAVRSAMIARYSKEAEIQATLKSIGGVVSDANTALKIANDLGIDVPNEVNTALNVAQAGFNAFASFASGNYLGAISSITGLFGGPKDADAERHKQMMEFLRKNFEQVNRRLDELRKGQARIMEGIVQVSEQIHALHLDIDARFRALDFRLSLIDRQLRQLIWEPWASCNTVTNFALFPSDDLSLSYVNRETLFFNSFQSRVSVLNADEGAVRNCMRAMNDGVGAVTSLDGWRRFGAFVDLERSLLDLSEEQNDRLERAIEEDGAIDYRPLLPRYLERIVDPSSTIVRAWANREALDGGTLLYLLAAAPQTQDELNSLLEVVFPVGGSGVEAWRFKCDTDDARYPLIGGAVCRTTDSEDLIDAHLKSALDTATLVEVSEWAVIIGQILDLYDGATDTFARSFQEVEQIGAGGAGQRLLRTLAPLMNLGIAYEQRLHGGLTAWIITEDIKSGRAASEHAQILAANPYIAENVAMLILRGIRSPSETGVSLGNRHTQAVLHSRTQGPFPFGPLQALYGDAQRFVVDPFGRPAIVISVGEEEIPLPLPGPIQLEEGRFILPIEQIDLIEARERIIERVIDYEVGADAELMMTLVAVQ